MSVVPFFSESSSHDIALWGGVTWFDFSPRILGSTACWSRPPKQPRRIHRHTLQSRSQVNDFFHTLSDEFIAVEPVRTKTPQSGSRRRYEIAKTTLALSITATVVIAIVPKTLLRRENLSFWLYLLRYLRFQRFPRSFAPSPHLAEDVKRKKQSF